MQIGDFVKGDNLHCSSFGHTGGVVVSLEPFQIVSANGDMYWSTTVKAKDMEFSFRAPPEMVNRCMQRVPVDRQLRFDVGDSLGNTELTCGLTLISVDAKAELCMAIDLVLGSRTYGWSFRRVAAIRHAGTKRHTPTHWRAECLLMPAELEKFASMAQEKKVLHFSTGQLMKSFHS